MNKFIRVYGHFQECRLIQEQNRAKTNPKRIEEALENVKSFVQENPRTSPRKFSPQVSCTKTTLWRFFRKDLGKKFYRYTSVQPLTT